MQRAITKNGTICPCPNLGSTLGHNFSICQHLIVYGKCFSYEIAHCFRLHASWMSLIIYCSKF